jgi:hypothetical protein
MAEWYEKLDEEIAIGLSTSTSAVNAEFTIRKLGRALGGPIGVEERFSLANRDYSYQVLLSLGGSSRISARNPDSSTREYYIEDDKGLVTKISVHPKKEGAAR